MTVQVFRDSRASCFAEVKTRIKAVRLEGTLKYGLCFNDEVHEFVAFFGCKLIKLWNRSVGEYKEVSGIIGISIHHDIIIASPVEYIILLIV